MTLTRALIGQYQGQNSDRCGEPPGVSGCQYQWLRIIRHLKSLQEKVRDQFASMGLHMKRLLIVGSLLAIASVGHGFNDVFNPISGFVDSSDRQSSINDQIPVVFGATFAASLFANLIFGSRSQNSNTAGKTIQNR